MIETDEWVFVPAKYFTAFPRGQTRHPRVIVMHDMEAPEKGPTARTIADYFATLTETNPDGSPIKKSAHVCVDTTNIVQCVHDNDIAYAAPGANADGLQIEMAGFGAQSREAWLDEFGLAIVTNAANVAAQYCAKYGIPPVRLTNAQLADKSQRGIVSHGQVSEVFKGSDHTDPGPNFPWPEFLARVETALAARLASAGPVTPL